MLEHIQFDKKSMILKLLDQRSLPDSIRWFSCCSTDEVITAIENMVVRGAPAIGVTAAYGCVLAAMGCKHSTAWRKEVERKLDQLIAARPTAVNLAWAVERMRAIATAHKPSNPGALAELWLAEAMAIQARDVETCRSLGHIGQTLVTDGDTILTHCNAGALATAGYGTALGVIRAAVEAGKKIKVIADETRPFCQGSRLTAFELAADGIPVTVACDSSCAHLMSKGLVQIVITGADRIAANGDTANKIGTLGVAILARHFNIPFYIAAPLSTVDLSTPTGADIPIESRPASEVTRLGDFRLVPENVPVYNFAFDVTPAGLIDGIITEAGILRPPYAESLAKSMEAGS